MKATCPRLWFLLGYNVIRGEVLPDFSEDSISLSRFRRDFFFILICGLIGRTLHGMLPVSPWQIFISSFMDWNGKTRYKKVWVVRGCFKIKFGDKLFVKFCTLPFSQKSIVLGVVIFNEQIYVCTQPNKRQPDTLYYPFGCCSLLLDQ